MHDSVPQRDANLLELLAARARHTSDARLLANAVGGIIGAAAVAYWHGPVWDLLLSAAVCVYAFGLWGIADRELSSRTDAPRRIVATLAATRVLSATLGFVAAIFLMLALLGKSLGRMIS